MDKVDHALGRPTEDGRTTTRPGRMNRVIYLGPLTESGRVQIAARILEQHLDLQAQVVTDGDGETAAHFQERCSRMALERSF